MKTSIELDEDLLASAQRLTGLDDASDVVNAALRALVTREAARNLSRIGGSDPQAIASLRRRRSSAE